MGGGWYYDFKHTHIDQFSPPYFYSREWSKGNLLTNIRKEKQTHANYNEAATVCMMLFNLDPSLRTKEDIIEFIQKNKDTIGAAQQEVEQPKAHAHQEVEQPKDDL
ncbi:unnamed protein product [Vicia faba]|uniref:Uncharacterized protein n=1 Tax=Vicia faba TaxID=3906 RepID=A0AAV1BC24_VICFA|nr:unnamed protein product [Vicia faba]